MTIHVAPRSSLLDVPLARSRDGTPIELPEDGVAWRVRRHTSGRPRLHLGADKQPMQFPLSYNMADLDDILPPGSYKLDLVDRAGNRLSVTIDVEIGGLRNAAAHETDELDDGGIASLSGASDLRFLLEANVRSTQLAFQHNQRTLEAGLRMADTLREGIQSLAETQADWIKAMVQSRTFLRNSAPPQLAAPASRDDDDDEDDGDDPIDAEFSDPATEQPKPSALETFLATVTPMIPALMAEFTGKKDTPAAPTADSGDVVRGLAHLAQIQSKLDPNERRILARVLADPKDGPTAAAELASMSVEQSVAAMRGQKPTPVADADVPAPPAVDTKATAIGLRDRASAIFNNLDPALRPRALAVCSRMLQQHTKPEAQQAIAAVMPLSDEDAAAWVASHLEELERRFAS